MAFLKNVRHMFLGMNLPGRISQLGLIDGRKVEKVRWHPQIEQGPLARWALNEKGPRRDIGHVLHAV